MANLGQAEGPGRLRAVGLVAAFAIMTLPAVVIQSGLALTAGAAARTFPHIYFRTLAKVLGIRVRVEGSPLSGRPSVWISNHVSWLDIIILGAVRPVTFVAKRDVSKWPVFGVMARVGRTVFIDRDRRHQTGSAKARMEQRLQDGETLVLFAEGTSSNGNRVLPFKSALFGAAELSADGAPVKVQPVCLALTHCHGIPLGWAGRSHFAWYGDMALLPHLWNAAKKGPIDVSLRFHEPVGVAEAGGRKALARHCQETIAASLAQSLYR